MVREGGKTTITTEYLSFTDDDTEPASLSYLVLQPPRLGYIQLTNEPGLFISDEGWIGQGYILTFVFAVIWASFACFHNIVRPQNAIILNLSQVFHIIKIIQ